MTLCRTPVASVMISLGSAAIRIKSFYRSSIFAESIAAHGAGNPGPTFSWCYRLTRKQRGRLPYLFCNARLLTPTGGRSFPSLLSPRVSGKKSKNWRLRYEDRVFLLHNSFSARKSKNLYFSYPSFPICFISRRYLSHIGWNFAPIHYHSV